MRAGNVATSTLVAGALALLGGITLMAADIIPRERAPFRLDLEVENWRHPPEFPARKFLAGEPIKVRIDVRGVISNREAKELACQIIRLPRQPVRPEDLPTRAIAVPGRVWWDYLSLRLYRQTPTGLQEAPAATDGRRWLDPTCIPPGDLARASRERQANRPLGASGAGLTITLPGEALASLAPGGYVMQAVYDTTGDPEPSLWHGRVDAYCYAIVIYTPAGDAARAAVLAGQASTAKTRDPQAALVMV
jgi:hypothetical protein